MLYVKTPSLKCIKRQNGSCCAAVVHTDFPDGLTELMPLATTEDAELARDIPSFFEMEAPEILDLMSTEIHEVAASDPLGHTRQPASPSQPVQHVPTISLPEMALHNPSECGK